MNVTFPVGVPAVDVTVNVAVALVAEPTELVNTAWYRYPFCEAATGVSVSVVEVAPAYDTAEITSFLANRVVLEMLSGIAYRRRGGRWDSIPKTLLDDR